MFQQGDSRKKANSSHMNKYRELRQLNYNALVATIFSRRDSIKFHRAAGEEALNFDRP